MPELDFEKGEILNINKPIGWTSFDVVKKVRNHIRVKVGHAGTLDPFAAGVLLLCTGRATKQVPRLMALEKEYVAQLELGVVTDTLDPTGQVVVRRQVPQLNATQIEQICQGFTGEIEQVPPMFSAVKVNGRRLYELARKGKTIERQPRKVTIYELELLDLESPFLTVRVVCSKGTYIRSLASDLGEALGCGAYVKALTRTRIGPYRLEEAWTVEGFIREISKQSVLA